MKQEQGNKLPESLRKLTRLDLSAISLIVTFTSREQAIDLLVNGGKTREESTQIIKDYYSHYKEEEEGVAVATVSMS